MICSFWYTPVSGHSPSPFPPCGDLESCNCPPCVRPAVCCRDEPVGPCGRPWRMSYFPPDFETRKWLESYGHEKFWEHGLLKRTLTFLLPFRIVWIWTWFSILLDKLSNLWSIVSFSALEFLHEHLSELPLSETPSSFLKGLRKPESRCRSQPCAAEGRILPPGAGARS